MIITPEQKRRLKSKFWRMNHLYKIVDKEGRARVFTFNEHQKIIWDSCVDGNGKLIVDVNILKARQIGITTFFCIFYLDDVIFTKNINACIISHNQDSLGKIFEKVRYAYDSMPEFLKPELDRGGGSKYELKFINNNSKIYTDLDVRSETLHRLHISEAAFAHSKRLLATIGALPAHIFHSMESTPNGMNEYYEEWVNAHSRYKKFFFPWYSHFDYVVDGINTGDFTQEEISLGLSRPQVEFRRMKKQQLKNMFRQEYPENDIDCFISSGASFFDLDAIKELEKIKINALPEKFETEIFGTKHEVTLFEKPKVGERYCIGADVSEGLSKGDYSALSVWRVGTRAEVAFFRGKIQPFEFAKLLAEVGIFFNRALMAVERNNHGHAVLQELDRNLRYSPIFEYSEGRLGWVTDKITKPLLLDTLQTGIINRTLRVNNEVFFKEAMTFVEDNGHYGALQGYHDDSIISVGIAIQVLSKPSHSVLPMPTLNKKPISQGLKGRVW